MDFALILFFTLLWWSRMSFKWYILLDVYRECIETVNKVNKTNLKNAQKKKRVERGTLQSNAFLSLELSK